VQDKNEKVEKAVQILIKDHQAEEGRTHEILAHNKRNIDCLILLTFISKLYKIVLGVSCSLLTF